MRKVLTVLAVGLLLPLLASAQTPVDALITLDNVSPSPVGTQITGAILNNGTVGTSLGFGSPNGTLSAMTVGPHQPACNLGTPVSIAGTTYIPATPSQSFAYNNSSNFSNWNGSIPGGKRKASVGVCVTFNSIPSISNLFDMVGIFDTSGHYVMFQLRNTNCINLETDGAGTVHSGCITGAAGATYWCTFQDDENGGTASLACYQPTYPYAQVGSTVTVVQRTGLALNTLRWGNNEIGTASTTTYFENMILDFTNAAFPLGIGTQSAPWAGILSPTRAIDWSKAGVVGGVPARTTICATLNPGASSAQINSAISSCPPGQTVFLNAGTYSGLSSLNFTGHPNVTLRGAGADQTILVFTGGSCGAAALICFESSDINWKGTPSNLVNWTAGYAPGTTVITLASVPNLKVGNPIILDQLDDTENGCDTGGVLVTQQNSTCASPISPGIAGPFSLEGNFGGPQRTNGGIRQQEQIVVVAGCNGSTTPGFACIGTNVQVTISPALYMPNWRASQSPQAWWATNPAMGDGIEDLTIDGTNAGSNPPVEMFNSVNTWVKGVRIIDAYRSHVRLEYATHATIRDSYFFINQAAIPTNYGFECYSGSDSLVENNIYHAVTGPLLLNGACEGNVIAYNFTINQYYTGSAGWNTAASSEHTAGNEFNLYEGNTFNLIDGDVFHGTHHFNTTFRNRIAGDQPVCYSSGASYATSTYAPCNNNRIALQFRSFTRFHNAIGNVLGTTGIHTGYQGGGDRSIYAIGNGNSNGKVTVPGDPNVGTTLMRWGNYDTFNAAVTFSSAEVPSALTGVQAPFSNPVPSSQGLPASFFLNAKPSWWPAAKPWPAIGPDVTGGNVSGVSGHAYTIPAQDCYLSTMGGPVNGTGPVLTFNASKCYPISTATLPAPPTGLKAVVN